jgi:hypothetical protein
MSATQIRGNTQIINGTIVDAQIASAAAIATSKLADGALFIKSDGTVSMGADLNLNTHKITNLVDPVNPQDAATRAWVLANVSGGIVSSSTAKAATTVNITLSGTQTVDGIALSVADICLVKNQTTPSGNGVYTVASGAWTRIPAMDTWAEVPGMLVTVQQGTTNADTLWLSTADAGGTLGTTSITFVQLPGPSDITAGAGLLRTAQVIDVVTADASMTINADSLQVKRDAAGAVGLSGSGLIVSVDGTTVEINANALRVKPSSIGDSQLSSTYQKQANIVTRETPTGSINGSNTTFTLAATPVAGSERVFLNGLLQEPGAGNDYTISAATITYLTAPATGDRLRVNYLK